MSGTAFGSIVLHVAPESAVGGPLALVQNGDRITARRARSARLELLVDDAELAARRKRMARAAAARRRRARLSQALSRYRAAGRPRLRLRFSRAQGYNARSENAVIGTNTASQTCPSVDTSSSSSRCKRLMSRPLRVNGRRYIVRRSKIHGRGVFALDGHPEGHAPDGIHRRAHHAQRGRPALCRGARAFAAHDAVLGRRQDRDRRDARGNSARFINHSCTPNCEAIEEDGRIFIETIRRSSGRRRAHLRLQSRAGGAAHARCQARPRVLLRHAPLPRHAARQQALNSAIRYAGGMNEATDRRTAMAIDRDQIERVYSSYAGVYDRVFGRVFQDSREAVVRNLKVEPGERVLEVGVGTGLCLPLYPRGLRHHRDRRLRCDARTRPRSA